MCADGAVSDLRPGSEKMSSHVQVLKQCTQPTLLAKESYTCPADRQKAAAFVLVLMRRGRQCGRQRSLTSVCDWSVGQTGVVTCGSVLSQA